MDARWSPGAFRRVFRQCRSHGRGHRIGEFRRAKLELASLIHEDNFGRSDRRVENTIEEFLDRRGHRQRVFQEDLRRQLAKHLERHEQFDVDGLSERVHHFGFFGDTLRREHVNDQLLGGNRPEQRRRVLLDAYGRHEF